MENNEKVIAPSSIYTALSLFQSKCPTIGFDATAAVSATRSYKYATLAQVVTIIRPILFECKLAFTQFRHHNDLITKIVHTETGEYIEAISGLNIKPESNPQQIGILMTYTKRYDLCSILGIVSDEDDDAASLNPSTTPPPPSNQGKQGNQKPTNTPPPPVSQTPPEPKKVPDWIEVTDAAKFVELGAINKAIKPTKKGGKIVEGYYTLLVGNIKDDKGEWIKGCYISLPLERVKAYVKKYQKEIEANGITIDEMFK